MFRIFLILALLVCGGYAKEIRGKVAKVYDGDTIHIIHRGAKKKIRLYGIDAPEINQNYGAESRNNLLRMCPLNSRVRVEIKGNDRYKRLVGIVYCGKKEANKSQVRNGFAWAYAEYSKRYVKDEKLARLLRKGLWAAPIEPKEWRKSKHF